MPLPDIKVNKVDELVATLRNSQKPNIVVEGKDDTIIYRRLVERIGIFKVDFHASGSRTKLLQVYDRRSEFSDVPVAFIADRDKELFTQVPAGYEDIIWTQGYSIENDLYAGAEPSLESLMDPHEADEHRKVLNTIVEWFAFEVEEFLAGRDYEFDHHCNEIVHLGQTVMDNGFRQRRGFRQPNSELEQQIREAYQLQLRGKQLFQMLIRFLSAPDRSAKYSYHGLYEIAFKMTSFHPLMHRLIQEIEHKIAAQTPIP